MSDYAEYQKQRYTDLVDKVAQRLRDAADRIEREAKQPPTQYSTYTTRATGAMHEIHVTLMNTPLPNLIEVAAEIDKEEQR